MSNCSTAMGNQLLFIVFLIDSNYKDHDGKVFKNLTNARDFCIDVIQEKYADKIIIGQFVLDSGEDSLITLIETHGFTGDKKKANQLNLFKHYNNDQNSN